MIGINSKAHHSAYFGKRALEAARGATFVEKPRLCKLIIVRVSSHLNLNFNVQTHW